MRFVVVDDDVKMVIQVWDINNDNIEREMKGLQAAMKETGAKRRDYYHL
jgi:hypothetical protein